LRCRSPALFAGQSGTTTIKVEVDERSDTLFEFATEVVQGQ
jgi:hypothetical protein